MPFAYFPFGSTRTSSGTLGTDKKFTGQRLDQLDLYFYNARYYDPGIGRFISADAVMPDLVDPQSLNRYTYCLNGPLVYTDPTGNFPWRRIANIALGGLGVTVATIGMTGGLALAVVSVVNPTAGVTAIPGVLAGAAAMYTSWECMGASWELITDGALSLPSVDVPDEALPPLGNEVSPPVAPVEEAPVTPLSGYYGYVYPIDLNNINTGFSSDPFGYGAASAAATGWCYQYF